MIIRFARYHPPFASLSSMIALLRYNLDLLKLKWTLLLSGFNYIRDLGNRWTLFSIPVAEYVYFSHQARTLKTNLPGLISYFSKYYFKNYFRTGTICLYFTCIYY